jgi:hypothetical protein
MTVVELLIVVAIMAIVIGGVGSVLLSTMRRYGKVSASSASGGASAEPRRRRATTKEAKVRVRLEPTDHANGLAMYRARLEGEFLLSGPSDEPVTLRFPFPNTAEATDVRLAFVGPSGEHEPAGVTYTPGSVSWTGKLTEPQRVRLTYEAVGSGRFDFGLSLGDRIEHLDVELNGDGLSSATIPQSALQPSETTASTLRWRYDNLVTDRGLVVEMPQSQTPLGRTSLMAKLAALAVLIFGAGFWYFGELDQPGRLDRFRWSHFLLLAATLSLFFVVFAVAGLRAELSTGPSLALAAVVSLPLLVMHVEHLLGWRFAIARALPLAVYALAVVGIGVFAGPHRAIGFVVAGVIAIATIILTFRRWNRGRRRCARERDEQTERRRERAALTDHVAGLEAAVAAARNVLASCPSGAEADPALAALEGELAYRCGLLSERIETALDIVDRVREMPGLSREAHRTARAEIDATAPAVVTSLEEARQHASAAIGRLAERREELLRRRRAEEQQPDAPTTHCMACGAELSAGCYCAGCGVRQGLDVTCGSCHDVTRLPVHLMASEWQTQTIHCERCGDRLAA